ncbi:MAG: carboxypeptidase regulatory-like domain-containing protein [Deltaproteobacteria bacterium]|nr:carboxypeptidase regulatory-like domain-containing protein [Deltaproteobacteria bacterium]
MPRARHGLVLGALLAVAVAGGWGCSGSARPAGDTGDVTGTTVEESTFAPVAGATVEVGGKSATTGADGTFTVVGVAKGEQKLTVSASGYLPFSTTVSVDPGANDVGQLWLKRSQQDGGAGDGGADDGGFGDGPPPDGAQHDAVQTDANQQDAVQTDAVQTDVLQTDVLQTDVLQTDVLQTDVIQTDVIQTDVMQDTIQTDLGQTDGPVILQCGTLALTATSVTPGVDYNSALWSGLSLTAPHATTPCAYGAASTEIVYWFDLDHVADLVWAVTPSAAWNVVAYIRRDCDGLDSTGGLIPDPVCADVGGTSTPEKAVWLDAQPGRYFFFVDGQTVNDWGAYVARLSLREIHDVGQTCDDVTARCKSGLTCQGGQCYELQAWCATLTSGTLVQDNPVSDTTTGGTSHLTCGSSGQGLGPDDLWTLTAGSAGTFVVIATSTDHNVFLYSTSDCTSSALAVNCSGGSAREAHFDVGLQAGETVYVVVDGFNGQQGAYSLVYHQVQFRNLNDPCDPAQPLVVRCVAGTYCDATSHCAAVQDEVESNNTPAQANAAASGRPIRGAKSTATDVDYFSISANAGDVIVAQTTDGATDKCADNSLDSRLRIFGPDGTTQLALGEDELGTWCSFVATRAATGGTYYVALDYYNGGASTFDYTLHIWVRTPIAVTEVATPNDDPASAQAVTLPAWATGALNPSGGDSVDYFKFDAPAGQRLYATTGAAACSSDDRVGVLAPDGTTLLASTGAGCDVAGSPVVPAAATYYARVTGSAAFGYTLLVIALPQ